MVNALHVIINHYGELISDNPVFALHDKIAVLLGKVMGNQALQLILKCNGAVIGSNAQRMGAIRRSLSIPANTGVNIELRLPSIARCQRFSAACARIDEFVPLQVADNVVINVDMPALIINVAVPMQAESFQGF
jgi:hypothetical protein